MLRGLASARGRGFPSPMLRALRLLACTVLVGCPTPDTTTTTTPTTPTTNAPSEEPSSEAKDFQVQTEQFGDVRVLRYQVPGFSELPLQQKKLAYYLYQAALSGRDIVWDQNYRHNLLVRRTLEALVKAHGDDRANDAVMKLLTYTKRVWFSNGIHHHYSMKKMMPEFTAEQFATWVKATDPKLLPLA